MPKALNMKLCQECQKEIAIAFRVRHLSLKDWLFVCEECCLRLQKMPKYQYGGTWKRQKKK